MASCAVMKFDSLEEYAALAFYSQHHITCIIHSIDGFHVLVSTWYRLSRSNMQKKLTTCLNTNKNENVFLIKKKGPN